MLLRAEGEQGVVLECSIFGKSGNQMVTHWRIFTNFTLRVRSFLAGHSTVSFGGTAQEASEELPTYQNRLTIDAFPSILDGVELLCGTSTQARLAHWPVRIYRKSQH